MVDEVTILLLVFTAIATIWAILATLGPKRKELGNSLHTFRDRTRDNLNRTEMSTRGIVMLTIISAAVGAAIYLLRFQL